VKSGYRQAAYFAHIGYGHKISINILVGRPEKSLIIRSVNG